MLLVKVSQTVGLKIPSELPRDEGKLLSEA